LITNINYIQPWRGKFVDNIHFTLLEVENIHFMLLQMHVFVWSI